MSSSNVGKYRTRCPLSDMQKLSRLTEKSKGKSTPDETTANRRTTTIRKAQIDQAKWTDWGVPVVKDITEADAIQFSKKNGLYVDNNFPPDSALVIVSSQPFFLIGQAVQRQCRNCIIHWKRPSEFLKDPKMFIGGSSSGDIAEGSISNSWFLGALAVIATRTDLLNAVCVSQHPEYGFYQFKFFKNNQWYVVTIDDYLPLFQTKEGLKLLSAHCVDPNEIWVPLIEKAYAKLLGSYSCLTSGWQSEAFVDLTGGKPNKTKEQKNNEEEPQHDMEVGLHKEIFEPKEKSLSATQSECPCFHRTVQVKVPLFNYRINGVGERIEMFDVLTLDDGFHLWKLIEFCSTEKWLLGCSATTSNMHDFRALGLLKGRCYSILYAWEYHSNDGTVHRLIQLRNPWRKREWTGKWADNDAAWTQDAIQCLTQTTSHEFDSLDGCFWIEYEDWKRYFTRLVICRLYDDMFGEQYQRLSFFSEWKGSTAGGCKVHPTWSNNPQFGFTVEQKCKICISLVQDDTKIYFHQTKKDYVSIAFTIFFTSDNTKRKMEPDLNKIGSTGVHHARHEVLFSQDFLPGKYILVPSTFDPGEERRFIIVIYSQDKGKVSLTALPDVAQHKEHHPIDKRSTSMVTRIKDRASSFKSQKKSTVRVTTLSTQNDQLVQLSGGDNSEIIEKKNNSQKIIGQKSTSSQRKLISSDQTSTSEIPIKKNSQQQRNPERRISQQPQGTSANPEKRNSQQTQRNSGKRNPEKNEIELEQLDLKKTNSNEKKIIVSMEDSSSTGSSSSES